MSIKKYLLGCVVGLTLFACGSSSEGILADGSPAGDFEVGRDIQYGVAKQPIFLLIGYGSENGTENGIQTPRCIAPWAGGECNVPDSRTMSIRVMNTSSGDSNCGTQASPIGPTGKAVNAAISDLILLVNNKGWLMSRKADNAASAQITIRCTGDNRGPLASTSGANLDCHDTPDGELCQFATADITIRMGVVATLPFYQTATAAQREMFIYNVLKHELGHAIGLGHTSGNFSKLMNNVTAGAPIAGVADSWDTKLPFDKNEIHMIECYRDSSGTTPACANP